MRAIREVQSAMNITGQTAPLPANFFNCYEITNASALEWPVSLYIVERVDGQPQKHEDRGQIKNIIFELRMRYRDKCKGYGFIVETDEQTVVVPASWEIPDTTDYKGYNVTLSHTFTVKGSDPAHKSIVTGIIREGIKKHFKDNPVSDELGILWQNYNSFCQMPGDATESGFHMCRKFDTTVKVLRGNRLALECVISTATLDGRTIADYYKHGEVDTLAEMIETKRQNRLTRSNKPPEIRVWQNKSTEFTVAAAVRDLVDPDGIISHARLTANEQRALRVETVSCSDFPRQPVDISTSELRLVLDAQITGEDHSDTIIDPDDREKWLRQIRNFINGADMYGQPLLLAEIPFNADSLPSLTIMPPAIRVKGENGAEVTIPGPKVFSALSLEARAKERMRHLRRYGFLYQRDIRPVLAFPERFGKRAAARMTKDINYILETQGIEYRFVYYLYKNADDLRKEVERRGYDAVLAVLPESSRRGYRPDDTHEKIKKRIEVPSQCVHIDNTLPPEWQNKPAREFRAARPKLAGRVRQTYELCLANLLVKHGWVPYAPVDPFNFNVHVGWDVGGRHNTQAMVCMGYGFHRPQNGLLFRPDEIPIDVRQAEPIPTKYLYDGLLAIFERMHSELTEAGIEPDFEYSLFIRDGALLGDGDRWNEKDALHQLHSELLKRKWVSENSVWPAVEILKDAEGLRLMRNDGGIINPLVGRCVYPFDDDNKVLICTTGEPYLSQGTASPIIARIVDIYGRASRQDVIRDIVWGADMAFTKPDTGMKLPWPLHVADTGALQMSRSYKISGITV